MRLPHPFRVAEILFAAALCTLPIAVLRTCKGPSAAHSSLPNDEFKSRK